MAGKDKSLSDSPLQGAVNFSKGSPSSEPRLGWFQKTGLPHLRDYMGAAGIDGIKGWVSGYIQEEEMTKLEKRKKFPLLGKDIG